MEKEEGTRNKGGGGGEGRGAGVQPLNSEFMDAAAAAGGLISIGE